MKRSTALAASLILVMSKATAAQTPGHAAAPQVPLREGLTIVTAVGDVRGDYESIKRITAIAPKTVTLAYSTDLPADQDNPLAALLGADCGAKSGGRGAKTVSAGGSRVVRREDLETAHEYRLYFSVCGAGEQSFPGSTALGVSSGVLRELSTPGRTRLSVPAGGIAGAFGNIIGLLGGGGAASVPVNLESGVLARVERGTVPFKTLVNDQPAELPAVHARGRLGESDAEFWILDDAANPLALRWSIGEQRLQIIKVSYPLVAPSAPTAPRSTAEPPASGTVEKIERELAKQGRTVVYGIYFDFASDRIKAESQPVLADIAKVLQQNPAWALGVEGHTDNIGGDPYNLDLSRRRAAAVKQALVTQYKVDAQRLDTSGYGASRPKDTNATLEGRARNRRVELAKIR
jgi:outer membrane protein OmpA-like peptidoglycan-associated protein